METPERNALLRQVRTACRLRHLSLRTEQAFLARIKQFILFHRRRNPRNFGAPEVAPFLPHLDGSHHLMDALLSDV